MRFSNRPAAPVHKKRKQEAVRTPLHLMRVHADIRLRGALGSEAKGIEARVVLNDISNVGMGIYSPVALPAEQEITISLTAPMKIVLIGQVVWCQKQYSCTGVLSAQRFEYRSGVRFRFNGAEDEEAVKKLCSDLQSQLRIAG